MEHFDLNIVPDRERWAVVSQNGADGPYATLDEALDIAIEAARVLQAAGHTTAIHMAHRDGNLKVQFEPNSAESATDQRSLPIITQSSLVPELAGEPIDTTRRMPHKRISLVKEETP